MSLFGSEHWMYSSGAASFYDHQVDGSIRLHNAAGGYLSRTQSAGNRKKFTFSAWVKLARDPINDSRRSTLFSAGRTDTTSGNDPHLTIWQDHYIRWEGDGGNFKKEWSMVFRDYSAWYHIVLSIDTDLSGSSNSHRLYVNGVEQTDTRNDSIVGVGSLYAINEASETAYIGAQNDGGSPVTGSDFYIAEVNFVDGQQLGPSSFGETKSGVWIPKEYSGSYGTNGFYFDTDPSIFSNPNVTDSSGNGNNWSASGGVNAHDFVIDSPTNNFAVLNAASVYGGSVNDGNLKHTSGGQWVGIPSTIAMSSGKWYAEYYCADANNMMIGVIPTDGENVTKLATSNQGYPGKTADGYGWINNANKINNDVSTSYGSSPANTDIIMIAYDADNGDLYTGKNGTWFNSSNPATSTSPMFSSISTTPDYYFVISNEYANGYMNFGQDSTFGGATAAGGNSDGNGYGDFKYSVPSGYLALCTANLTVAEGVDPAEDNSPQDHFSVKLYPGNGSTQSITGVGFEPSITWIKSRNHGHNPELYQAVEGATRMWMTSYTNSDTTRSNGLTSFNSDGFSLGNSVYTNQSGLNFVSWNWKANGAGSSNPTGSITSTVSANPDAGISIMKWTGTGASGTIGHGLSNAPKFLINKCYYGSTSGFTEYWNIWCTGMSIDNRLLFSSDAQLSAQGGWGGTEPSDSLVYLGSKDELNGSGGNFSMIAFAPVEGFSSFGSYVGNGSTNGPFVYTGCRVAYVLVKKISAGENWSTADTTRSPFNVSQNGLQPGTANAENTTSGFAIDFLSNGFKPRSGAGQWNDNGATYIYAAFAENPFKYANAR